MAITSSAITWVGKQQITKLITGLDTDEYFGAIGVGNDNTAATENTTIIIGDETCFKIGNQSYYKNANDSYISQWNSTFGYNDLTSHVFKEVAITQNNSNATATTLLRGVFDQQTLGSNDWLDIEIQLCVTEG
jgi:hypothetical protein